MRWMIGTLAAAAFLGGQALGLARAQSPNWDEKAHWKETFAGYKGVAFRCSPNPQGQFERDLCNAITEDARFLAATSKTAFFVAEDAADQSFLSARHDLVSLTVTISLTEEASHPVGVYIQADASAYYLHAIEAGRSEGPDAIPRPGTLVLWDRNLIGAGARDEPFKAALVSNSATLLKNFFSVYLEARAN